MMSTTSRAVVLPLILGATLALSSCGGSKPSGAGFGDRPSGSGGPPPAKVLTSKVERRPFGPQIEAVGTARRGIRHLFRDAAAILRPQHRQGQTENKQAAGREAHHDKMSFYGGAGRRASAAACLAVQTE